MGISLTSNYFMKKDKYRSLVVIESLKLQVGLQIKTIRELHRLSYESAAKLYNISAKSLKNAESGNFTFNTLCLILLNFGGELVIRSPWGVIGDLQKENTKVYTFSQPHINQTP